MTDIPSSVCSSGTPLVSMGTDSANAPKLNYNLPQDTCFDAYVSVNFAFDNAVAINPDLTNEPTGNYWQRLANVGTANANDIAKIVSTQFA